MSGKAAKHHTNFASPTPTDRCCQNVFVLITGTVLCLLQKSSIGTLHSLKDCAKCHTQSYCSRECQKNDWKSHKKSCATSAETLTPKLKDELLESARTTISLILALSRDPNVATDRGGLFYLNDFVCKTWQKYWPELLPEQVYGEMSAEVEVYNRMSKADFLTKENKRLEEKKKRGPTFDKDAWPRFSRQTCDDCFSRNAMAALIVQTPERQPMMGGRYEYTEEVQDLCKRMMPGK